jgi:hypothetical protein
MQKSLRDVVAGAASGAVTYFVSIYTLAYTSAFAMPLGFPVTLWAAIVVFGMGASLVAFALHLLALRVLAAKGLLAFAAFAATAAIALAAAGQFAFGSKALLGWLLGALLASVVANRLRSGNSLKPKPLRGSA